MKTNTIINRLPHAWSMLGPGCSAALYCVTHCPTASAPTPTTVTCN